MDGTLVDNMAYHRQSWIEFFAFHQIDMSYQTFDSKYHEGSLIEIMARLFPTVNSKEELQGQIATLLGGRSAEEIIFGKVTTGASNDLQRATDIAEQMVGTYGMSDILGPLAYDKQGGGQFLGGNNNPRRELSDATAQAIDKEVRSLVDDAHEKALNILKNNLSLLEDISQKILEKEVIEGDDLIKMLSSSVMPEKVSN